MMFVSVLRPMALAAFSLVTAAALAPASSQQRYGAPVTYGDPYRPPPVAAPRTSRARLGEPYRVTAEPYRARPALWHGFYIGGNGAYVSGSATPAVYADTVDLSGGAFGIHGGYNWQFNPWVFGIEGDFGWSNADGSRGFAGPLLVSSQNDWLMSARLRAGYSISNVLLYATAGIAWGNFDLTIADSSGWASSSDTLFGYVVGGGIEMKLAPNWSARVEGLYYGFGDSDMRIGGASMPFDASTTTIRAGVTYHFN